eukprot:13849331-Alexandrium_andersonii.AAC.1
MALRPGTGFPTSTSSPSMAFVSRPGARSEGCGTSRTPPARTSTMPRCATTCAGRQRPTSFPA